MAKKIRKSKEYRKPSHFAPVTPPTVNPPESHSEAKSQSNAMVLISAGLATAILLFFYYHFWALGQLADLANGIPMPDQRILGFGTEDVTELRAAMAPIAAEQLVYVHRSVGIFFPLLFGFFSLLTLGQWLRTRKQRWLAWLAPIGFVVVDLWSNQAIDALFVGELDTASVTLASTLTIIRWVLLLMTVLTLLIVGGRKFTRTFKRKYAEISEEN